jgi:hypothetical protein
MSKDVQFIPGFFCSIFLKLYEGMLTLLVELILHKRVQETGVKCIHLP